VLEGVSFPVLLFNEMAKMVAVVPGLLSTTPTTPAISLGFKAFVLPDDVLESKYFRFLCFRKINPTMERGIPVIFEISRPYFPNEESARIIALIPMSMCLGMIFVLQRHIYTFGCMFSDKCAVLDKVANTFCPPDFLKAVILYQIMDKKRK
jgi:hypothetical protein